MDINQYRLANGELPSFTDLGGYSLYYLDHFGAVLCPACANKPEEAAVLEAVAVNWEDTQLFCDACMQLIEAAYADEDG